jgi:TatD DNase family protein
VGTDDKDSQSPADFALDNTNVWASVGVHPHEAKLGIKALNTLKTLANLPKVVAIGECGLDYYYQYSSQEDQVAALRFQLELGLELGLPIIFHVRDAYDDFWPIFDDYKGIKGVFHCFSANKKVLDEVLKRDLSVGLNGIATFSKNQIQLDAFKAVPIDKLLLETDAPYLTPTPLRGKVNESKNIPIIAEFLSELRGESLEQLAIATTANARKLFRI